MSSVLITTVPDGLPDDGKPLCESEDACKKKRKTVINWPDDHEHRFRQAGLDYPPKEMVSDPMLTPRERSTNACYMYVCMCVARARICSVVRCLDHVRE